jgi:hypothetical protein
MMPFENLDSPIDLVHEFEEWIEEFDENCPFPPDDWNSDAVDKKK